MLLSHRNSAFKIPLGVLEGELYHNPSCFPLSPILICGFLFSQTGCQIASVVDLIILHAHSWRLSYALCSKVLVVERARCLNAMYNLSEIRRARVTKCHTSFARVFPLPGSTTLENDLGLSDISLFHDVIVPTYL
jgi:hypothetical protein